MLHAYYRWALRRYVLRRRALRGELQKWRGHIISIKAKKYVVDPEYVRQRDRVEAELVLLELKIEKLLKVLNDD